MKGASFRGNGLIQFLPQHVSLDFRSRARVPSQPYSPVRRLLFFRDKPQTRLLFSNLAISP
jgi:hypothetical protein